MATKRRRELGRYLPLLFCGERVDDAVDGLRSGIRMERCEDQVARFGGRHRGRNGNGVAHFADHNNVRVLAQNRPERRMESHRIAAHFALGDNAFVLREKIFHRVLDGDDMVRPRMVDLVENGGQGR